MGSEAGRERSVEAICGSPTPMCPGALLLLTRVLYRRRDKDNAMADQSTLTTPPIPTLQDMQHWTWVMGRAQQLMMEHVASNMAEAQARGVAAATADPKVALGVLPGTPVFA